MNGVCTGCGVCTSRASLWPPCSRARAISFRCCLNFVQQCAAVLYQRGKGATLASSRPCSGTHRYVEVPSSFVCMPLSQRCPVLEATVTGTDRRCSVSEPLRMSPPCCFRRVRKLTVAPPWLSCASTCAWICKLANPSSSRVAGDVCVRPASPQGLAVDGFSLFEFTKRKQQLHLFSASRFYSETFKWRSGCSLCSAAQRRGFESHQGHFPPFLLFLAQAARWASLVSGCCHCGQLGLAQ